MFRKYKSIDLFAGIGGIRLGFEQAFQNDIETVFVSEWDTKAQETYRANFKDDFEIAGDITKIPEADVPDFDICLAGFPCQAFSIAGKRMGFDDDYRGNCRGTLFLDVARICEQHHPKVIFCENVKGLVNHDRGRTFRIICQTFENLGYRVFSKILNSKDFGVPQNRERIYIVAFRNDIAPNDFTFPKPNEVNEKDQIDIRDILEKEPVPAKYYLSEQYLDTLKKHKKRHFDKGNGFGYEVRDSSEVSAAIVCGGMGRERNLVIDKRQKNLIPTTNIKGKYNTEGIRRMTPREWARLQGFPEDFILPLADTNLYKQLGNSVTVPVIRKIALKIRDVLNKRDYANTLRDIPLNQQTITSDDLKKFGLVSNSNGKGAGVFAEIASDFLTQDYSPSEYVKHYWNKYKNSQYSDVNGQIFELIIGSLFIKEGITPIFRQSEFAFVPDVKFDYVLYTEDFNPITISLKTSLRERYKQAELEAMALKYVHRGARNYLFTLDEKEANNLISKIQDKRIRGIDEVVIATSKDFDNVIDKLKQNSYIYPGKIDIIQPLSAITQETIAKIREE